MLELPARSFIDNILVEAIYSRFARCELDRKSTRLNSSHQIISYAVFCLKKKKIKESKYSISRRKCRNEKRRYHVEQTSYRSSTMGTAGRRGLTDTSVVSGHIRDAVSMTG